MNLVQQQVAEEFAESIIARNYEHAHRILAPWLRDIVTSSGLQEVIEERLQDMMQYAGCHELTYPIGYSVDGNSVDLDDLREPDPGEAPRQLPPELTVENFRKWACIQFLAGDDLDIDAWFDLWIALIELNGRCLVGYFELADPD